MAKKHYSVLVVDDSEDDRLFMRRALREVPKLVAVGEARDGQEAIDYLSGAADFRDREKYPFPDVMLLDLKMPRKTGHDVLKWLKSQPFKDLAVVVVSGSLLPEDMAQSLALGAIAYHKKPALKEEQAAMFRDIENSVEALQR